MTREKKKNLRILARNVCRLNLVLSLFFGEFFFFVFYVTNGWKLKQAESCARTCKCY